jgi:transposase
MLVAEEAVEIRVLSRQGRVREIARMLKVSRNTVRRYLRSEGLPRYARKARRSKLDPYKQYLAERVKAATPDWIPATVLLRELRALGYPGGYSMLKDHLARLRPVAAPALQSPRLPWRPGSSRHGYEHPNLEKLVFGYLAVSMAPLRNRRSEKLTTVWLRTPAKIGLQSVACQAVWLVACNN